jgi:hypothetical protein
MANQAYAPLFKKVMKKGRVRNFLISPKFLPTLHAYETHLRQ